MEVNQSKSNAVPTHEARGDRVADAVIVSAYGRGNWLASELAGRGWKVTLADVTESLGPWQPEDAEGPFGFFDTADIVASQKTRLFSEGETVNSSSGMTFWFRNGPVEGRSELTSYQLQNKEISKAVEQYLRKQGGDDASKKEAAKDLRALSRASFQESWFAHLCHQLASPVIEENHAALSVGEAIPFFAPFSIRKATTAGWQKGLQACQVAGVRVRAKSAVKDIRLAGRSVDAIEINDDRAGVEKGRTFVWMLSSLETQKCSKLVAGPLFSSGAVEPDWYWARFSVAFGGNLADDEIPQHVVLVEDPFLPWTHANVLVLRKRAEARRYDVWSRLPIRVRFDADYLKGVGTEIASVLSRRLPQMDPTIVALPIETKYSSDLLGGPRIPVFEAASLAKLNPLKAANLFFSGPEQWSSLDWQGQFRQQQQVLAQLEKLRAAWLAAEARQAQKNAHP